jgi:hypothetical protein
MNKNIMKKVLTLKKRGIGLNILFKIKLKIFGRKI